MKNAGNGEQREGFLKFLDAMKDNLAEGKSPQPAQPSVWVMRILKPGDVEEVRFEEGAAEPGANTQQWQIKGASGNPAPQQPAMQPPKVIEQPATPSAAEPDISPPSITPEPQAPQLSPETM